ncbi:MAG TPA: signal peptidase I [Candidatus Saccharimonadia bacterium]|nr:signal peptidase I [Candidatus Saccharimonadia bacterium]
MESETKTPNQTAGQPDANQPSWTVPTGPAVDPVKPPQPASPINFETPTSPVETEPAPDTLQTVANGFKAVLGAVFSWIIFPIAVVLILHNFVFQAYHVLGTSMVPTLHDTDYLIISKLGSTQAMVERLFGQDAQYIPARGQIIVFHYPKNPTEIFVKRVIGLPGDRVVISDGTVTVYNKAHPGGYNPDTSYEPSGTVTLLDQDVTVRPGNVFVMGDNRTPNGSYDSREWGELPSSYIIGNTVLRLLPLDQVRVL